MIDNLGLFLVRFLLTINACTVSLDLIQNLAKPQLDLNRISTINVNKKAFTFPLSSFFLSDVPSSPNHASLWSSEKTNRPSEEQPFEQLH